MSPQDISTNHEFSNVSHPAQTIKVIGVGGGGNNAVNHMFEQGIKDVSFVLINTDRQVLDESDIPTRITIGPGRGAGGKPEIGRKYAEDNAERIAELFAERTDMVFVTAGMGGGTGTGAGPVVARIAKERNILTVGIVTIPFIFEGRQKVLKALEGAKEMEKNVDALMIINNQRLTEIYPDLDLINAFARADETLLIAAKSITDIITKRGIINRDFNDVDSALREGGAAIISTGYGEGPDRITKAIAEALHSPLLKNTDIFGSKKMLLVVYMSPDEGERIKANELDEITNFVNSIDNNVDVMWGLYQEPGLGNKVKITLLASGFNVTVDEGRQAVADDPAEQKSQDTAIAKDYGPEAIFKFNRISAKARIIDPSKLDDDNTIADLEEPAFRHARRPTFSRPATPSAAQPDAETPKTDDNSRPGTKINFNDI